MSPILTSLTTNDNSAKTNPFYTLVQIPYLSHDSKRASTSSASSTHNPLHICEPCKMRDQPPNDTTPYNLENLLRLYYCRLLSA